MIGPAQSVVEPVELFPSIRLIQAKTLRVAVVSTWRTSLEDSPYDDPHDVPQNPILLRRSLCLHVNEVAERSLEMYVAAMETGVNVDRDVLLAAVLLHDVDKPSLYRVVDGEFAWADGRGSDDHGPLGARLALANGIPERVAQLIAYHSPFSPHGPDAGSAESTILHYADLTASDIAMLACGQTPLCARTRIVQGGSATEVVS
jgi:putative nucleotidyltransferase with HDIG domain